MNNRQVTSREYKVILNSNHFAKPIEGERNFIDQIENYIGDDERVKYLQETKTKKYRRVQYLDTPGHDLRNNGYIFRVRHEDPENKYKYTLKYRHNDRYLSALSNVSVDDTHNDLKEVEPKTKFEQDILYGFRSKFAHSTSLVTDTEIQIASLDDLLKIFPGLESFKNSSVLTNTKRCIPLRPFMKRKLRRDCFHLARKSILK